MSSRFYQVQPESRSSALRPQPQSQHTYAQRTSASSESSSSSSSSSSSRPSSYSSYLDQTVRYSMDSAATPRVEVMRCSRCAKCVEAIISSSRGSDVRRVSADDAMASGMVRFGHNLYYCERCARMVGYK